MGSVHENIRHSLRNLWRSNANALDKMPWEQIMNKEFCLFRFFHFGGCEPIVDNSRLVDLVEVIPFVTELRIARACIRQRKRPSPFLLISPSHDAR